MSQDGQIPFSTSSITVYTIGHGNDSLEHFCGLLIDNNIKLLIDVRSAPYSRFKPEFNRESLKAHLKQTDIEYRYAGEYLGGRPKDPQFYKGGEVPPKGIEKSRYLELVDYGAVARSTLYLDGIERLLSYAQERRVVIMCSEENPDHCHRKHLITKSLLERDVTIKHVRRDGTILIESVRANIAVIDKTVEDKAELPEANLEQLSLF